MWSKTTYLEQVTEQSGVTPGHAALAIRSHALPYEVTLAHEFDDHLGAMCGH